MAGLIMIRRERDGYFHARPTFVCEGMGYNDPKPEGKWTNPWMAFQRLIPLLPETIKKQAYGVDRWRMYHAPEYIDMSDRCVEIDGHKPDKLEWKRRRERFLLAKKLGHETY